MQNRIAALALIGCLGLQACSSRPRNFEPTLATPSASQADFEAAYATCRQLLAAGKLNYSGRGASLGAGAGAGAGTAAVGGTAAAVAANAFLVVDSEPAAMEAVASGTAAAVAGGWGGVALASATIVLLPVAVIGGAWGMSRMKRARKEHAIKTAMEGCLQERGFKVSGWSKAISKPLVVKERQSPVS